MKCTLCIPRPAIAMSLGHDPRPADEVPPAERILIGGTKYNTVNSRAVYRFRLRHTTHHPASSYGIGVLIDYKNQAMDGFMFRYLRDRVGAWIETDDPEVVFAATGLPPGEKGIVEK